MYFNLQILIVKKQIYLISSIKMKKIKIVKSKIILLFYKNFIKLILHHIEKWKELNLMIDLRLNQYLNNKILR